MPNATRIPTSIPPFVSYMDSTDDYQLLNNNYQRWTWTSAEATDWHNFRGVCDPLWNSYKVKKFRTLDVIEKLRQLIKDVHNYDKQHKLLDRIASSPSSVTDDFDMFHLKRGTSLAKSTRTRKTEPIQEECHALLKLLGGGKIKVLCRTDEHSKRAQKALGADSVKTYLKIGDPAPQSEKDGTDDDIFSKASFIMNCGNANLGKKMYLFVQWYNTKHPELAGPVSELYTRVIA